MIYVALLRGINVGGRKKVAMADLRALLAGLGFDDPRTLLQSGNLVFGGRPRATTALERAIQEAARLRLGLESEMFVRTADEWHALVAANPFPAEARRDPGHLLAMCLHEAPAAPRVTALRAAIRGPERVEVRGREAYLVYPDGVGTSKLTHTILERHLGSGTARNWNTVLKLAAAVAT
ncbi:MAG: DUF1697 domain-containing protein [Vicinamibacterales bacterium]